MTVSSWLGAATARLVDFGIPSAQLEAELLLADVLHLPRLEQYLHSKRDLTATELLEVESRLKRRCQREPSQHILGTAAFLTHTLLVNRHVLIPRPETEQLAILGIEEMRRQTHVGSNPRVLDFGTGSGALAIALAGACAQGELHALDCSEQALEVAKLNAERSKLTHRIAFHQSDRFSLLPTHLRFSLIVANPPYIPSSEIAHLPSEVRDFEPHAALDGGVDGLDFFRHLAAEGTHWLLPGHPLMAEFGDDQGESISNIFIRSGWRIKSIEKDLSLKERILIVETPQKEGRRSTCPPPR